MKLSKIYEVDTVLEYIDSHNCVRSEKGKNLGCKTKSGKPYTRAQAKKRLAQVEYFKHKG